MSQVPEALWQDGPNTAVLEIRIHQDDLGHIWSVQQFKTPEDEQKTFSWPGGGARQLAFAFLTEALRREAAASIMVELTKDNDFLKNYKAAEGTKKVQMEGQLSLAIQAVLSNSALKMGDAVAKEILQMFANQV